MNKAVFVTGATKGTGYAICERFAKEGYDVFLTSRNEASATEAAEKLSKELGIFAKGYALGIRDEARVSEIFADIDKTGRNVETVVLCAADLGYGTDPAKGLDPFECDIDVFRTVLETNIVWDYMIVREAAKRMREYHKGAIVFLASNTAYRAIPNRTAYCASKGGMLSLSRALAVDFGPYGIRSNAILPGTIKTERWVRMGKTQISNGTLVPIGDISDFEDIANAAYFLGSEESKNITGAEIIVDGGMSCQLYPQELNRLKKKELDSM